MTLPRKRPVVGGRQGAVASAHPLASQAGLDMLRDGGNAVDAVVTMAATLAVVEPYMSGPAGVGFLLSSILSLLVEYVRKAKARRTRASDLSRDL